MSDDDGDGSEKDKNQQEKGEKEALGRSFIADTPDEDPRFETADMNTTEGEGGDSDGGEDSNDASNE